MTLTASDVDTSKQGQHAARLQSVGMSLEALHNVIRSNAGVEVQCIGHFKLIFSLLRLQGANKLVLTTLQVRAGLHVQYMYTQLDNGMYSGTCIIQTPQGPAS